MTDHLIRCNDFIAKNDGNIDFSINQKNGVQEPVKNSVFSRRDFDFIKPQSRICMHAFEIRFNK